MKRVLSKVIGGVAAGMLLMVNTSCDWSSGGGTNAFNTSQGAGININFSGFYRGEFDGGRAVADTTAGNINTFNISQVGNNVTVVDNQGSTYTGTVGAPGLVSQPSGGVYPDGAELVQAQINFAGRDGVSALDIEFVGIIHVVSVTDIQGTTSSETTGFDNETVESSTITDGDTTTETITTTIGSPGDPFYSVTVQVIVTDNTTGQVISNTTTSEGTTTTSSEFSITEANSQYRLEGTWVEIGAKTSPVQARSPGTAGVITTTTTDETAEPVL